MSTLKAIEAHNGIKLLHIYNPIWYVTALTKQNTWSIIWNRINLYYGHWCWPCDCSRHFIVSSTAGYPTSEDMWYKILPIAKYCIQFRLLNIFSNLKHFNSLAVVWELLWNSIINLDTARPKVKCQWIRSY